MDETFSKERINKRKKESLTSYHHVTFCVLVCLNPLPPLFLLTPIVALMVLLDGLAYAVQYWGIRSRRC